MVNAGRVLYFPCGVVSKKTIFGLPCVESWESRLYASICVYQTIHAFWNTSVIPILCLRQTSIIDRPVITQMNHFFLNPLSKDLTGKIFMSRYTRVSLPQNRNTHPEIHIYIYIYHQSRLFMIKFIYTAVVDVLSVGARAIAVNAHVGHIK